jgi:MFS family permease
VITSQTTCDGEGVQSVRYGISLGPLRERNFRNLWIGRTASTAGDSLSFVALAFAVLALRGSGTDLGLVITAFSGSNVLFLLVGGVIADRVPRRAVMIGADLVRAGVQLTLAVAVLTGSTSLELFLIGAALAGASTSFFQPAVIGLVPEAVSEGRLQQANATLNLSGSMAQLFGPVLSGLLVATIGAGWVFAIDAVSFLVSAIALASLRLGQAPVEPHGSFVGDLVEGWREVRRQAWLPPSLATFAFVNLSFAGFLVLGPIVMSTQYGGAPDWGLAVAMFGVGGLLGGAAALRWRPARPLILVFALIAVNALRLVGFTIDAPLLVVLGFVLVASAATTYGDTIWHTTVQQQVPRESLSRVSSYDWMVSMLFFPIGAALAGPLADAIGATTTLLVFAGLSAVPSVLVLQLPSIRAVRREDGRAGAEGAPEVVVGPGGVEVELARAS